MILEGRKLTAFDAMEAVMSLSELYMSRHTHKSVDFRYSQPMEAIVFQFGRWKGFDFILTDNFVIYLDNTISAGNTFKELFDKINEEIETLEKERKNEL